MRIEKLRKEAIEPKINYDKYNLHFHKAFIMYENEALPLRYAKSFAYALDFTEPVISDGELIVGKPCWDFTDEEKNEWDNKFEKICNDVRRDVCHGQDSHMAVDYELLLSKGISGIIEDVERYKSAAPEKSVFYDSCLISLKAVVGFSRRYSAHAEKLADSCRDEKRKQELIEISEICRKVPENPAESFFEAVQSVNFILLCLSLNAFRWFQQFQGGRPDRYLYKYYVNDINSGKLTQSEAQEIIDCFCIQINNRVPSGLSSGYMVGGRDSDGKTVANELTKMFMTAIEDVRLVYPAVGFCYTPDMPDELLKYACEILSHGRSHPAIFNDDIIAKGLVEYGVPEKDATSYIHSTCVEITPIAASNVWVASPYTNMPQFLLDAMSSEYDSFDSLLGEIFERLDKSIRANFEEQNGFRELRMRKTVNPLLSCFVNDCLSLGTDIEHGGARYNWIMPSFVGMANLVDSLYVLKSVVFEKGEYTLSEIRKMLECNFEGYEAERQRFLNNIPKYGNDIDDVDGLFDVLKKHIVDECRKYKPMHRNGLLIPSVFCFVMHEKFGKKTGATPDGRLSGFPLGDGSGPCQGREKNGPTASVISSTKWSHHELIGGVAVNLKFSRSVMNESSLDKIVAIVKTYMQRGGFELQINVTDNSVLKDAALHPENYSDLVVRIGGYSDYFVRLSREMQEEVILRTGHEV